MSTGSTVISSPGVRRSSGRSWGSSLVASVRLVVRDPGLWLLGGMSFLVRGGVIALVLPVFTMPTPLLLGSPVILSIIFRGDISTSGVSEAAGPQAIAAGIIAAVLVIAALFLTAYADVIAFERAVTSPATEALRGHRLARALSVRERRGLVVRLAGIEATGLLPIVAALSVVGTRISQVVVSELQFPSNLVDPLFVRILGQVQKEILLLVVVILVADVLVTLVTRHVLVSRYAVLPDGRGGSTGSIRGRGDLRPAVRGLARTLLRAPRVLGTAVLCWLIALVALVPAIAALALAWSVARGQLLPAAAPADGFGATLAFLAQFGAVVLFGAIWVGGITLAGFASSLRAAVWTGDTIR